MTPGPSDIAFACPIPSAVHPQASAIDANTTSWLLAHGLVQTGPSLDKWSRSRYGWLPARCHPGRDIESVALASDWNAWLFALDDLGDATGLGTSPTAMHNLTTRMLGVIHSGDRPDQSGPAEEVCLAGALMDLRARLLAQAAPGWLPAFTASCEEYFDALAWEAANRAGRRVPDMDEYVTMRRRTGAVACSMFVGEVAEDIRLPAGLHSDPVVEALRDMANNLVCWQNDVLSAPKELAIGEVHNYVAVLMHHERLSREQATAEVVARHNQEMARFCATEHDVPYPPGEPGEQLGRLIAMLRAWIRGNLDWSFECGRYNSSVVLRPSG